MLDFDHLPARRSTNCVKWDLYDADVLPMWVADMDFPSPEPVIRALHQRVEHGVFGYPMSVTGKACDMPEVVETIIERLERLYGWQVGPEEIVLVPGVVTAFNQACHTVAEPGGSAVVQTPVYPPFLSAPANAGLERRDAPLVQQPDGSYAVDLEAFEAAITPGTRLFMLCNPHNPVGRVFRRDELEAMAEICLRTGLVICSDEIHCDLLFSGHQHIPIAALGPEVAAHTITLMAPSKTYNLAGLEFSFAVIQNDSLRRRFRKAAQGLVGWVNIMGLVAAQTAYREGQPWLDQVLAYLEGNRDFLSDFVNAQLPGVKMARPEGTYLAWLDCRQAGVPGDPYDFFLKDARVALNKGSSFGPGGEGFARLNFGCPRPVLVSALERMRDALLKV